MRRIVTMLLLVSACAGERAPREVAKNQPLTAGRAPEATAVQPASSAAPPSVPPSTPPAAPSMRVPLVQQLAREAAGRPARAVRFAALIEALGAEGVQIGRRKQVLASPIGAAYCEAARSVRGLGVVLCEFADAAAAAGGAARSKQEFEALVPGRTLRARENTLLTLTQPVDDAAAREAEMVEQTFASLAPM